MPTPSDPTVAPATPTEHTEPIGDFGHLVERPLALTPSASGALLPEDAYARSPRGVVRLDASDGLSQWLPLTEAVVRAPIASATRARENGVDLLTSARSLDLVVPAPLEGRPLADVIAAFERTLVGPDALCAVDDALRPGAMAPRTSRTHRLLLIHGAFTTLESTFGDLRATEAWANLRGHYGDGGVLAFSPRALSDDPVESAIELARALPEGARLRLLTHGQGGFVGELLARAPDAPEALEVLAALAQSAPATEARVERFRAGLTALSAVMHDRDVRVERLVRVACPVRGVPLSGSQRHAWLSATLNALASAQARPSAREWQFARAAALALMRASDEEFLTVAGIASLDPRGPLVRWLSVASRRPGVSLRAVAGAWRDAAPSRLGTFVSKLYFQGANDLVTHTRAQRTEAARDGETFVVEGPHGHHWGHFRDGAVRERVSSWLTAVDLPLVESAPVAPRAATRWTHDTRGPDAPVVFIVPGFPGTELKVNGDLVWVDPLRLLWGDLTKLRFRQGDGVTPGDLFPAAYGALRAALSLRYVVRAVPYDWRRLPQDHADELARQVAHALGETPKRAVHFVGHSNGGVIIQAMFERMPPETLREIRQRQGRAIFLGTPSRGTWNTLTANAGVDPLVKGLAAADPFHTLGEICDVIKGLPGLLALLTEEVLDAELRPIELVRPLVEPVPQGVKEYWALRQRLLQSDRAAWPECFYIRGQNLWTPSAVRRDGEAWVFDTSVEGDGRVLWRDGALPGMKSWYLPVSHSLLAAAPLAFPAFDQLLRTGDTDLLPENPPFHGPRAAGERAPDSPIVLRSDAPSAVPLPTTEDILDAAMGADHTLNAATTLMPLRVSLTWGDLHAARFPVLVGLYAGDAVTRALDTLDRLLDGRVRERLGLRVGPRTRGETAWIEGNRRHPGALLVCLGEPGTLNRATITEATRVALLRYALDQRDRGPTAPNRGLSALILGATRSEKLSIADAARAIVEGALAARDVHDAVGELEFIEAHEDRKDELARYLLHLQAEYEGVDVAQAVRRQPGWLGPVTPDEFADSPRRSVRVTSDDGARFSFSLGEEAAGAVTETLDVAPDVREEFKRRQSRSYWSEAGLGADDLLRAVTTRRFRELLDQGRNVLLDVDAHTAVIPWELYGSRATPAVVRQILIRRFATVATATLPAAQGRDALLIADPDLDSPAMSLPGARAEAAAVARRLSNAGYAVAASVHQTGVRNLVELLRRPYRVLHVAAHGELLPDGASVVLLGRDTRLTSAILNGLDAVPPFVFFNCCFTGAVPPDASRFVANLAAAFLSAGVRAFVAAAWAVDDQPAERFADVLYEGLLRGVSFGNAVRDARRVVHREFPASLTWAAYQCYGDPDYVLDVAARDGFLSPSAPALPFTPAATSVIDARLKTLQGRMQFESPQNRGLLRAQVAALAALLDDPTRDPRDASERDASLLHYRLAMLDLDLGDTRDALCHLDAACSDRPRGGRRADPTTEALNWWYDLRSREAFTRAAVLDAEAIATDAEGVARHLDHDASLAVAGHAWLRASALVSDATQRAHLQRASQCFCTVAKKRGKVSPELRLVWGLGADDCPELKTDAPPPPETRSTREVRGGYRRHRQFVEQLVEVLYPRADGAHEDRDAVAIRDAVRAAYGDQASQRWADVAADLLLTVRKLTPSPRAQAMLDQALRELRGVTTRAQSPVWWPTTETPAPSPFEAGPRGPVGLKPFGFALMTWNCFGTVQNVGAFLNGMSPPYPMRFDSGDLVGACTLVELLCVQELLTPRAIDFIRSLVGEGMDRVYVQDLALRLGYVENHGLGFATGRVEVLAQQPMYFKTTAAGADTLARKGAWHLRVRLPRGPVLDVVNTHLQSSSAPEARRARAAQLDELVAFCERVSAPDRALVVCGDLNVPGTCKNRNVPAEELGEYVRLCETLGQLGLRDVVTESPFPTIDPARNALLKTLDATSPTERLDYVFFRAESPETTHGLRVRRVRIALDAPLVDMRSFILDTDPYPSDHFAVRVDFEYTPRPA